MLYCRPILRLQIDGLSTLEEKADWEAASSLLRSALANVEHENHSLIANIQESIACSTIRRALQAENTQEFDLKISEAIAALQSAGEQYSKSEEPDSRVLAAASLARATFLQGWKASTGRDTYFAEAFTELNSRKADIARLGNLELRYSMLGDLLLLATEWASVVPYDPDSATLLDDLLGLTDDVLESGPDNFSVGRARSFCLAGQLSRQASFWARNDRDQAELASKAVRYARRSKEVNEAKGGSDRFLTAGIDILLGQALADFESEPKQEETLWSDALKLGRKLKDHYIVSWAASLLSYNMETKLAEAEEPEKMNHLAEDCFHFGQLAVSEGSIVRFHHIIASTLAGPVSNAYYILALSEPSKARRRKIRENGVGNASFALESAKSCSCLLDIANSYHSLSKAIEATSIEEADYGRRRKLLDESLKLRKLSLASRQKIFPAVNWGDGVQLHYMATLFQELATLETGETRDRLLSRALKASSKCIEYCSSTPIGTEEHEKKSVHLARYLERHAMLLELLNSETRDRTLLDNALLAYRRAGEIYDRQQLVTHSASIRWHSGKISHALGFHEDSARDFRRSGECYSQLEKEMPTLSSYFHKLAVYMKAWSYAEAAHQAHLKGEYGRASGHYREAATFLQQSPGREYLSANFLAWATLDSAEDLSQKEKIDNSPAIFEEASILFEKCRELTMKRQPDIEDLEERLQTKRIESFTESQGAYCRARALLDQGRAEELRGDWASASRLHDRAARLIEAILQQSTEEQRPDLVFALNLAKGWSLLCLARAHSDPRKFLKAAALFEASAQANPNRQASQFAMGNKYLSQALASETRFVDNADTKHYRSAKRLLQNASSFYSQASMDNSSLEVDARLSMLDASFFINRAENSPDPRTRTEYFALAGKCLRHSLQVYRKVGDQINSDEVEKLLGKISERKRLGQLLKRTLDRPVIASPTSLLSPPPHGPESAVGVAQIEERHVEGQLDVPGELSDDEEFPVTLDLVNVGTSSVSLLQLTGLPPENAKVVRVISKHSSQDGTIDLEGKRLQPKAVESVSIKCISKPGLLEFNPRVIYLNGLGRPKSHQVAKTARHVLSHSTFEFAIPNAKTLFDFLAAEFVADYMVRHMSSDTSGWRSFPLIVKKTRLARSVMYGPRGLGRPLGELVKRGLVEIRVFPGQPGRGGKVQRARVCYDKNPVRQFADRLAMKTIPRPNTAL